MLVIGASATLQAHGFVDAVFFTFVGVSRVCSSHSRRGFFSLTMVGVQLVQWCGSPLVVSVWVASFLRCRCVVVVGMSRGVGCWVGLACLYRFSPGFPLINRTPSS